MRQVILPKEAVRDKQVGLDNSLEMPPKRAALQKNKEAQYTRREEHTIGAEGTRRALMMPLGELVNLYLQHAGAYGKSVALSEFGLSAGETQRIFSGYDEDYHISRFFHFSEAQGEKFIIDGIPATHVSIDAEIETIL